MSLHAAVHLVARVGVFRHDEALLFEPRFHWLVVGEELRPHRFVLFPGGILRNEVAFGDCRKALLLAVGESPDVPVVGHAVHGVVVQILPSILGVDVEARPDGPSALDDEPDLPGRQGVDRELHLPACVFAVEPLPQSIRIALGTAPAIAAVQR